MATVANLAGSVKVYKSIRKNRIWRREPFTYAQAFLDLILLAVDAQSAPQTVWCRGQEITLLRGQVGWSVTSLSKEWDRTKEWTIHFLEYCIMRPGMPSLPRWQNGLLKF